MSKRALISIPPRLASPGVLVKATSPMVRLAPFCLSLLFCGLAGCATQQAAKQQQAALDTLASDIAAQKSELQSVDTQLGELRAQQAALAEALASQAAQSALSYELLQEVADRPPLRCVAISQPTAERSANPEVRTVVMQGDKMVVGSVERIWIDPPGVLRTARVDSGAESSSLHAQDLVEFERDGNDWVRFVFRSEHKDDKPVVVEKKVVRHVRVVQQSNPEGDRRPVVEMRVILGDIQGSFEFTLADRGHLDQGVLLGRNFLTDVAVVDVGRSFVQKAYEPSKADTLR